MQFDFSGSAQITTFLIVIIFSEPNTPGKFIVWFRNETTLLVLWQPPYPVGIYTHYKVSIDPPDAVESVLYVEKEGEPPGPAQAAFKDLVPGPLRHYYKQINHKITQYISLFDKFLLFFIQNFFANKVFLRM